ncbi:MAG: bifunctional phosphoserine phosphatase/homoserine phosphotransferase ThrH [Gammaproteobacteria bacterium]|nr:bifunctional phosphoserine phosphatase/homoserine phosphotransferase ThrH [Gammaproteobacteria bacterium]MYF53661.1 bifunctional phosphoserine phosphatase/homoserine phosphotransferase ThrH [Gammaproteobacteria bacterium]MYK44031.1 bifunctional phosphoserine phosphatase/homoserine phosphotransferase ThrH [Gammaproteobacteria bacterium]
MYVLCLDLEGVLVPEFWMELSIATGIPDLGKTTRDIPDYAELMRMRLRLMKEHQIRYTNLQSLVEKIEPFTGAKEFLSWARRNFQVMILSDTFYEFANPIMSKLNHPFLLCHHLKLSSDSSIVGYVRRQEDPKTHVIRALRSINLSTIATGDSYNDVGMINEASHGFFFNPPTNVVADHPDIAVVKNFEQLKEKLEKLLSLQV